MKKAISVLLALVLVLPFAVTAFAEGTLEENGGFSVCAAVVVVAENASETDFYAAKKLKYYLDKITGGDISVVEESEAKADYEIFVGATNQSEFDLSGKPNGSYVLHSDESSLEIFGSGSRGTIYGVYGFLEKYCSCRWYEAEVVVIPENKNLKIPANIHVEYEPYFEYTETDTASTRNTEFAIANGLNGGVYSRRSDEEGGSVDYLGSFCHTLTNYFCQPSKYFEQKPELYALRDGERTKNQLCLTNPETIDIVTNEVIALLEKSYDPTDGMKIVSLTQADNDDYCECESCKALDEANGSQSGTMLTFVNAVAERVKAVGNGLYDEIVFDTFAYQYTRQAPTNVEPREDVIVRLCSFECCFCHTLDDSSCPKNIAFMSDLSAWSEICKRIYVWDYVNNYHETCCIFPNFGVLQRNVQIFAENNVKGVYEEGNYYVAHCDAEFAEMRTYLLAKLMQDPYMDYYAEMDGYLNAVYGPGGEYIRKFIDITIEKPVAEGDDLNIFKDAQKILVDLTRKEIKECDELWEKALAAAETEEQTARIERSQLCWRYWKCANRKREFSVFHSLYKRISAQNELYNDLVANGITTIGENMNGGSEISDCDIMHYLKRPVEWKVRYENDFLLAINPYIVKLYNWVDTVYNFFRK